MAMAASPVRYGLIWLATLVALLWPAFLNGGAIWFPDSLAYLNAPKTALELFFGPLGEAAQSGPAEPGAPGDATDIDQSVPYAGRAIYFGGVMYLILLAAGPWGVLAFQAGLFAAALLATVRAFVGGSWTGLALVALGVSILTPAAFFTSYMMPDFLAGLTILAGVRLLGLPEKPVGTERVLWWLLLAFAVTAHTTHLLLLIGLAIISPVVFWICQLRWEFRNLVPLAAAAAVALAGSLVFSAVVSKVYGQPPLRPPFLAARMIDDGPGTTYLKETCPASGYELCAFVDRLPLYSDDFLWSRDPENGVYGIASAEQKRKLSEQQYDFALAVLAYQPWEQIKASASRFAEQVSWFGLSEFEYLTSLKDTLDTWWSGDRRTAIQNSGLYRGTFPLAIFDLLTRAVVLTSAAILLVSAFAQARHWRNMDQQSRLFFAFALMLILGILGNAAIAGILSTPHARYQSRVIWLLPMLSFLVLWRSYISVYLLERNAEKQI